MFHFFSVDEPLNVSSVIFHYSQVQVVYLMTTVVAGEFKLTRTIADMLQSYSINLQSFDKIRGCHQCIVCKV